MSGPVCSVCRAVLASGNAYCENCGARVPAPPASETNHGTTPPGGPAPMPIPAPAPSTMPAVHYRPQPTNTQALLGAPAPNQTYLGSRLLYGEKTTEFDPLSNAEFLQTLKSRFFGFIGMWFIGAGILFLVFGIPGIVTTASNAISGFGDTSGGSGSALLNVWWWLTMLWSLFLALSFWLTKIPVQLSEWMLTVDGQGAAARPALDHMRAIIAARLVPIRALHVIQLHPGDQRPRDYLHLSSGVYDGFVSSFAYGTDLFIGWTFWLSLSPLKWAATTLGRTFRSRGVGIYGSLLYDPPKAMREVMHSAVRQGVDVATGETAPLAQGEIGSAVPVRTVVVRS
jgi:hypothetical protein